MKAKKKVDSKRSAAAIKAWETKRKSIKKEGLGGRPNHNLTMESFQGTLVVCCCGAVYPIRPSTTVGQIADWYIKHI